MPAITNEDGGKAMLSISKIFPRVQVVFDHTFLSSFLGERSVVVDVGANVGGFAFPLIEQFNCRAVLCEPVGEFYNKIPDHPRIRKFPYCIARRHGTVTLVLPDDNCASTYYTGNEGHSHSIEVEGITYRDFLDRINVTEIDLLKVDIEGAEIELVDSLTDEGLRLHRQLAVEFHDFLFPELKSEFDRISRRIIRAGFYRIPYSVGNVDVLFVRRDIITYAGYLYLFWCVRCYYKIKDVAVRINRKMRKILRSTR